MSETKIVELDELKLVGFRVWCSGEEYIVEIPKASFRLSERISEIKQVVNPLQQYGAFVVENETVDKDGYWVCVEVKEHEDISSDMVTLTIPSQRYAVTRHKGDNNKIMNTYDELHKWHLEKFFSWKDVKNVDVELFDTICK